MPRRLNTPPPPTLPHHRGSHPFNKWRKWVNVPNSTIKQVAPHVVPSPTKSPLVSWTRADCGTTVVLLQSEVLFGPLALVIISASELHIES